MCIDGFDEMTMTIFYVSIRVELLIDRDKTYPADKWLDATYSYRVGARDKEEAKETALDSFHNSIPIKRLEDFQIEASIKGDE